MRRKEASKDLEALSGDLTVTQLDVADPASIDKWAQELKSLVDRADVVINNAGACLGIRCRMVV